MKQSQQPTGVDLYTYPGRARVLDQSCSLSGDLGEQLGFWALALKYTSSFALTEEAKWEALRPQ